MIFPTPLGSLTRRAHSKNTGVVNVPRSTITNRTSIIGMGSSVLKGINLSVEQSVILLTPERPRAVRVRGLIAINLHILG